MRYSYDFIRDDKEEQMVAADTNSWTKENTMEAKNNLPKYPNYDTYLKRMKSYIGWPGRYVQKKPEELASAGLFYIGSADRVSCYHCGITLRDWEKEHDPVTEHKRYSEHCQFIQTFIKELDSPERTKSTDVSSAPPGASNVVLLSDNVSGKTGRDLKDEGPDKVKTSNEGHKWVENIDRVNTDYRSLHNEFSESSSSPKCEIRTSNNEEATNTIGHLLPLIAANKPLKEERTCKVCKKEAVTILFLPCGHLVTCSKCSETVQDCVVCRKPILGTVKIYFA